MKNKVLGLTLIVIMLTGILFVLTGCSGTNSSNNISENMNIVINEELAKWQDRGYGITFTIFNIQSDLDNKEFGYKIVASGDKEFISKPDFTEYKENEISGYDGNSYSNMRMLLEEHTVNYFVVLDVNSQKYYNVEVTYAEKDLNGAKKEYPVFSNAKELK